MMQGGAGFEKKKKKKEKIVKKRSRGARRWHFWSRIIQTEGVV